MYQKQLHSRDGFLAVLLSCTPDVYTVHEQSVGSLEINLNSFPFFGGPYSGVIPLQGHSDLKKGCLVPRPFIGDCSLYFTIV